MGPVRGPDGPGEGQGRVWEGIAGQALGAQP